MPIATTTEQGSQYAQRLIEDTWAEHFDDAHYTELENDLLDFVVHDLTDPYHKALHAEHHSLAECPVVIGGITVTLRDAAIGAFATTLFQFVAERQGKIGPTTLDSFCG